jgi:ubiquinone/menaquinone biosynthesis C-methylase UbiE
VSRITHNEQDRAIWNHIFSDVPAAWRTAPPSRAMIECTAFLQRAGARSVLDLGCGIGRWAVHFARAGLSVSASDFAEHGVGYARQWAGEEGLAIRFVCCSVTEEAFPGESFDAVVAALVLDNITQGEMAVAIERMRSALRPGGVAFCLFNPVVVCAESGEANPTEGITRVVYRDAELVEALAGFDVLGMRVYEAGTRGVYLQRPDRTHAALLP